MKNIQCLSILKSDSAVLYCNVSFFHFDYNINSIKQTKFKNPIFRGFLMFFHTDTSLKINSYYLLFKRFFGSLKYDTYRRDSKFSHNKMTWILKKSELILRSQRREIRRFQDETNLNTFIVVFSR